MKSENVETVCDSDNCNTKSEDMTMMQVQQEATVLPNEHMMQDNYMNKNKLLRKWAKLVIIIDGFEKELAAHYKGEIPKWLNDMKEQYDFNCSEERDSATFE